MENSDNYYIEEIMNATAEEDATNNKFLDNKSNNSENQ